MTVLFSEGVHHVQSAVPYVNIKYKLSPQMIEL